MRATNRVQVANKEPTLKREYRTQLQNTYPANKIYLFIFLYSSRKRHKTIKQWSEVAAYSKPEYLITW